MTDLAPRTSVHALPDRPDPDPGRDHFTSGEVIELTGATYRQVDYWAREGYLGNDDLQDRGSGRIRHFTRSDLEVVHAIVELSALGARTQWLRSAADVVRHHPVRAAGEWLIVPIDGTPRRHPNALPSTLDGPAWIVPLHSHGARA